MVCSHSYDGIKLEKELPLFFHLSFPYFSLKYGSICISRFSSLRNERGGRVFLLPTPLMPPARRLPFQARPCRLPGQPGGRGKANAGSPDCPFGPVPFPNPVTSRFSDLSGAFLSEEKCVCVCGSALWSRYIQIKLHRNQNCRGISEEASDFRASRRSHTQ